MFFEVIVEATDFADVGKMMIAFAFAAKLDVDTKEEVFDVPCYYWQVDHWNYLLNDVD